MLCRRNPVLQLAKLMPNWTSWYEDDGYCPNCGADLEPVGPPGVMHARDCQYSPATRIVRAPARAFPLDPAKVARGLHDKGWIACIGKHGAYLWHPGLNRTNKCSHDPTWLELYKFNKHQAPLAKQQEALWKAKR